MGEIVWFLLLCVSLSAAFSEKGKIVRVLGCVGAIGLMVIVFLAVQ